MVNKKTSFYHFKMIKVLVKMDKFENDLEEALNFMRQNKAETHERDFWLEKLTTNLIALDEYVGNKERKRLILATQNVIGQLEVFFEKEKPPFLLFDKDFTQRNAYLPGDHDPRIKDSLHALGNTYTRR